MSIDQGYLASIRIDIYIPSSQSLKEKRAIIQSLKEKIRSKKNVSVAEVGQQELWQTANLLIATVAKEAIQAETTLQDCIRIIESKAECVVISAKIQWY